MRRTTTATALWLIVTLLATGSASQQTMTTLRPPRPPAVRAVPVTDTGPGAAMVVRGGLGPNTHPWRSDAADLPGSTGDLPAELLAAYSLAVALAPPACHLSMSVLAAIGEVESGSLAGHGLDAGHRVVPEIRGPALDGRRFRAVKDTDGGRMDGDPEWDRALGPMQFLPSSWRAVGVDLDGDGSRDPQDIYDAAGAAMLYLCAGGRDLGEPEGLRDALLTYNRSAAYVERVLAWKVEFDTSVLTDPTPPTFFALWTLSVAESGLRDAVAKAGAPTRDATAGGPAPVPAQPLEAGGAVAVATLPPPPASPPPASPPPASSSPTPSPVTPPPPPAPPPAPAPATPPPGPPDPGSTTPPVSTPPGPESPPSPDPPATPEPAPSCPSAPLATPPSPEVPPVDPAPVPDPCLPAPGLDPAAADPALA